MGWKRAVVVGGTAVLVGAVLASCGSTATSAAQRTHDLVEATGGCSSGSDIAVRPALVVLDDNLDWVRATTVRAVPNTSTEPAIQGLRSYELGVAVSLATEKTVPPSQMNVDPDTAGRLDRLLPNASSLIIGLQAMPTGPVPMLGVVGGAVGNQLVFAGECLKYATKAWQDFSASKASADPAQLFERLWRADGARLRADYRSAIESGPLDWSALPAGERALTDEETPAGLLAGLNRLQVSYRFPFDWTRLHASLCTKTSLGWNGCVSPSVLRDEQGVTDNAFAVKGEPLEVWVLDDQGNMHQPIVRLGTVPADLLAADGVVELSFDAALGKVQSDKQLKALPAGEYVTAKRLP